MSTADPRPLIGFLAVSLALHAALLGWLRPFPAGAPGAVPGVRPITVALLKAPDVRSDRRSTTTSRPAAVRTLAAPRPRAKTGTAPANRVTAPIRPRAVTARPTEHRPRHPAGRATTHASASSTATHRTAAANATATPPPAAARTVRPADASRAGTLTQRLHNALTDSFRRYFRYPPLARQRGWQGQVVISLRVDPNGSISRLKIARSSGYPVLDRAALRSFRQIRRLPQAALWLGGRAVEMTLPVRYELIDG